MDHDRPLPLAPCLIGRGTLARTRDMVRALETIESLEYRYVVHGELVDSGRATLVKLMADPESATLLVNGCLFLNVASFRYIDFERLSEDRWLFRLYGDGSTLEILSIAEEEDDADAGRQRRLLLEREPDGLEGILLLDEDEDEE